MRGPGSDPQGPEPVHEDRPGAGRLVLLGGRLQFDGAQRRMLGGLGAGEEKAGGQGGCRE